MSEKLCVAVGSPESEIQPELKVVLQNPSRFRDAIFVRDVPSKTRWVNAPNARLELDYGDYTAVPAYGWLDRNGWWPDAAWGMAMKHLDAASDYRWKPTMLLGEETPLRVLTVEAPYAAEKLLCPEFLEEAQRLLRTEVVCIGVPRRGVIYACDAKGDPEELREFTRQMKTIFWAAETRQRLTESPALVSGSRLIAWMQSDAAEKEAPRLGVQLRQQAIRRRLSMPGPSIRRRKPLPTLEMPSPQLMRKE